MGKGSESRVSDTKKFNDNFDRIFDEKNKKELNKKPSFKKTLNGKEGK